MAVIRPVIGRCYCGACSIEATAQHLTVAYCHCEDCRRWTGAAVAAFVAFDVAAISIVPKVTAVTHPSGVTRQNCPTCGSPLSGIFPYLPDQIYVPIGVLNDPESYPPQIHCFANLMPDWLHLVDDLPKEASTGRDILNDASNG